MNDKLRRAIAREGLVLLCIIGIGCLIITSSFCIKPKPIRIEKIYEKKQPIDLFTEMRFEKKTAREIYTILEYEKIVNKKATVKSIGLGIIVFGFPIYLMGKFVIWAIEILRQK